jgi:hypothetical protein
MSRAQQGQVFDTAQGQQGTYNSEAQTSFNTAQQDVNNYGDATAKFAAANPYVQGGAVETADNQQTADAAAGFAQSTGQALQGSAVRTGQNAGGAIAATDAMEQQNERALVGQEASQTASRAAAGSQYGAEVVGDTANQENMQNTLAKEQQDAAAGNLSEEEAAAKTPSFMDELGQGLISAGTGIAGKIKV